jgi:phosphohistidine phosphatase
MELILWRHAEAEDIRHGSRDEDRELTARGRKQAKEMAKWLLQRIPEKARILVSPARRTVQTADALNLRYELVPQIGTTATPSDLLDASGWPDGGSAVLLIGHQPTLGEVATLLLTGSQHSLQLNKGAVCWLSGRKKNGRIVASLRAMIEPEMLSGSPHGSRR